MTGRTRALIVCASGAAAAAASLAAAHAQTVDAERPRTLVVGLPVPGSAAVREPEETGRGPSPVRLPTTSLRAKWRASLGISLEHPAAIGPAHVIYAAGSRGDVVALSFSGDELWRLATGFAQPGASTVLSDGTVVFVSASGEAVGTRDGFVRWHTKFGRGGADGPAPLALQDGGAIVASGSDVAALDAEGHERAHLALAEPGCVELAAAAGRVAIVTAAGTVWTWMPGEVEATRVASFGAPVEASAAAASARDLFAVAGARLVAVDLSRGTAAELATARGGLLIGPVVSRLGTAFVRELTPAGEFALALDGAGREVGRAWIGSLSALAFDGGAPPRTVPLAALLLDAEGTLAFAARDGAVGVVVRLASQPTVERLAGLCPDPAAAPGSSGSSVVGLTPLGPGEFLTSCRSGTLVAVGGD